VFINQVLSISIRFFARLEKYDSFTEYNTSVAVKLTSAMFINTAIVAWVVYYNDWYGSDSLVSEVYNIILANAFLSPFMYLFSVTYFLRRCKRRRALK
jgi:hypothetical protein